MKGALLEAFSHLGKVGELRQISGCATEGVIHRVRCRHAEGHVRAGAGDRRLNQQGPHAGNQLQLDGNPRLRRKAVLYHLLEGEKLVASAADPDLKGLLRR